MMTADQPEPGNEQAAALPPLFPSLPVLLGDYELTQLLGRHGLQENYIARQTHVERRVVLELLRPEAGSGEALAQFLALARARSGASLPNVAPVLETATTPEGYALICQGLPEGTPLSAMAAEGRQLTVPQVCALISAAAELYAACAEAGLAAGGLSADMVFMSRAEHVHFLSPVLPGSAGAEGAEAAQLRELATAIRSVRPLNVPGQGRIATLLQWMQEGYEGEALDWQSISGTAALIAEQLKPEAILHLNQPRHYDRGREERAGKRRRRQQKRSWLLGAAALCCIIGMGVAGVFLAPDAVPPVPALRGGCVHMRVGENFRQVDASPVSIADYARFLSQYPELEPSRQGSLTQNIPPADSDPTPANWEAQRAAAQQQAPVTGVSYWQALMYARFHRAALPTAAMIHSARNVAGHPGIEEWTQDEHPATDVYSKARIVLPAEDNASPIPENNPAASNAQRGFRLCH